MPDKQDLTIAYSVNGSWYFNKTNTFLSFEKEITSSIQFNGEIINMMFSTKFVYILTPRYLTLIWLNQPDIVFNLNYIFKSPSNFFCLDLKITIYVFSTEWNFLHLLVQFSICVLWHNKLALWFMERVSVSRSWWKMIYI